MKRLAAAALVALFAAGCAEATVVRDIDGLPVEGRFISERAYALYARAAEAEARGELGAALVSYAAASEEDPESAAIWTRIGAVHCAAAAELAKRGEHPKEGDPEAARAFEKAIKLDAAYQPTFLEQAKCAMAFGHPSEALDPAARAVALDPELEEATLLHARVLGALGRTAEAQRALEALTVRSPRSLAGYRAWAQVAIGAGDLVAAARAARGLRELDPAAGRELEERVAAIRPLAEIDAALIAGDLARARQRALDGHVDAAEVAVRAVALGRAALGREQAALVAAADPSNATARIALASAADLLGDADAAGAALAMGAGARPPSPLARLLYAELLLRRVGVEAARDWLSGFRGGVGSETGEALLARVDARVRARLGLGASGPERAQDHPSFGSTDSTQSGQ